jgi:glycerol kinase
MRADSGTALKTVKVDGGLTGSENLLSILANLTGIPVERPTMRETTALGSAIAAGLAVGVWKDVADVDKVVGAGVGVETFDPKMKEDVRESEYGYWKRAVEKSFEWSDVTEKSMK